jgi:hypothetical protein
MSIAYLAVKVVWYTIPSLESLGSPTAAPIPTSAGAGDWLVRAMLPWSELAAIMSILRCSLLHVHIFVYKADEPDIESWLVKLSKDNLWCRLFLEDTEQVDSEASWPTAANRRRRLVLRSRWASATSHPLASSLFESMLVRWTNWRSICLLLISSPRIVSKCFRASGFVLLWAGFATRLATWESPENVLE